MAGWPSRFSRERARLPFFYDSGCWSLSELIEETAFFITLGVISPTDCLELPHRLPEKPSIFRMARNGEADGGDGGQDGG